MAKKQRKFADDGWAVWIDGDDTSTIYINDWLNPKGKSYVDMAIRIRKIKESKFFQTVYCTLGLEMPIPAHPRCRCCIVPVVEDTDEKYEQMQIEEPKKPIQKAVAKPTPTPLPNSQNVDLTLQNNKANIQLDIPQQRAQEKVRELQQQGVLHVYNKNKASHIRHVKEILGVEEVDEAAWATYEKMASDFLKRDIDGDKMDGFISREGWLFKFEKETGLFGLLSDKGTISTFFIPDKMTPEEYWKEQIAQYKPKE